MSTLLFRLRRWGEISNLTGLMRILRFVAHFGPWRHLFIRLIQLVRPPENSDVVDRATTALPSIDANSMCSLMESDGFSYIGVLRPDTVSNITRITDNLPIDHFQHVHEVDQNIRKLINDPKLLYLVRRYLNAEPVMLECTLVVTGGSCNNDASGLQNSFHFDYAGWQSVNLFVYLTDVDESSACHKVILGSHRRKTLKDLFYPTISDADARKRFGDKVQSVTGAAGTLFLENTEAFHKRQFSPERRVMLNVLFASHRSILSNGRLDPRNVQHRNSIYARYI